MKRQFVEGALMCLALAVSSAVTAQDWLYAADVTTNIIYGAPEEGLGTIPAVPISGHAAISADSAIYLNPNEVFFIPNTTKKLVHLNLNGGVLTPIDIGGAVINAMQRHVDGHGVSLLVTAPAGSNYRILEVTRSGAGAPFEVGSGIPASGVNGQEIAQLPGFGWAVLWTEITPPRLYSITSDGTVAQLELPIGYKKMEPLANGGFAVFGPGVSSRLYNAQAEFVGTLGLNGSIESSALEAIYLGDSPAAVAVTTSPSAVRGSVMVQQDEDVESVVTSEAPFDWGGYQDDLAGGSSILPTNDGEFLMFHQSTGGFIRFNPTSKSVRQHFQFHRGRGLVMEEIKRITSGPDGRLYVLDRGRLGFRVIAVDPASGNRSLVRSIGDLDILDALHVGEAGEFTVIEKFYAESRSVGMPGQQKYRLRKYASSGDSIGTWQTGSIHRAIAFLDGNTAYLSCVSPMEGGILRLGMDSLEVGPPPLQVPFVQGAFVPNGSFFPPYRATFQLAAATKSVTGYYVTYPQIVGQPPGTRYYYTSIKYPSRDETIRIDYPAIGFLNAEQQRHFVGGGARDYAIPAGNIIVDVYTNNLDSTNNSPFNLYLTRLSELDILVDGSASADGVTGLSRTSLLMARVSGDLQDADEEIVFQPGDVPRSHILQSSSFVQLPGSNDILAVRGEGWKLSRFDASTETVVAVGDIFPNVLDPELAGHSMRPWIEMTIGQAPKIPDMTGWFVE